jgi:methylglutaconyl-CoA hydratase
LPRMEFQTLSYGVDRRIATIVLHTNEKHRTIDDALIRELTQAVVAAGKDPAVKVILLKSLTRVFCEGLDGEQLRRAGSADLDENLGESQRIVTLFRTIHELRKPVIAVVTGPAMDLGGGLVAACDIVVATTGEATFGFSEIRVGLIPALALPFLIKRVGEGRARMLALRGATITAAEAAAMGLVNLLVSPKELEAQLKALLDDLVLRNSGNAMALCKELLSRVQGMNLLEALDFAANMNAAAHMTSESKQGIQSLLNNEQANW